MMMMMMMMMIIIIMLLRFLANTYYTVQPLMTNFFTLFLRMKLDSSELLAKQWASSYLNLNPITSNICWLDLDHGM